MPSPVIQRIRTHFSGLRDLHGPILVPEWGEDEDTPFEIYYRRPTMLEKAKIEKAFAEHGNNEGGVEVILLMALNGDGERIFRNAEKHYLMTQADYAVIDRIIGELSNIFGGETEPEDVGKS